ncbi:MAG: ribonuclease H-like domain-containing protein [Caldilineae bacterium]|nr:ribonuclease H-like domain-containing protein [Chloroflexota bacterium]MCB9176271.1 ribonuclease H-like domain-containing protein [Caldilineae bacterium]
MPEPGAGRIDPDLAARLARLGVSVGVEGIRAPEPPARDPEVRVDPHPDRAADGVGSPARLPIEEAVPGREQRREDGACYVSTAYRALDELHAGERLGAALEACTESLAALAGDAALSGIDLANTAFLDTETTGLMGGTGTYAFLIGVGRFVGPSFQVRQFFMRGPGEERAQLAEVADWIAPCSGLVTFNGRSYDMPLLATRCTLHRRPAFLAGAPHLDLLPAARRLWRLRLESCALTALERDVLGLARQDDVPGWLIPYRYFRYQQDGDARPLVGIFEHNALDILSMVSLLSRVARAYRAPDEALAHAEDWFSLARAYERAGEPARALAACRRALDQGLPAESAARAWETMGLIARRSGDWSTATGIWRELVAAEANRRLYPYEELAKFWEHRAEPRDPDRALTWSRRALERLEAGDLRPRRGLRSARAQLQHRIGRLERRLGIAPDPGRSGDGA